MPSSLASVMFEKYTKVVTDIIETRKSAVPSGLALVLFDE